MKIGFIILFLFVFNTCQRTRVITYEQGLEQCNRVQEEMQKEFPDKFTYIGPDCIVGAQIPDFEATSMDGKKISRASLKGKLSVINFWFISCPPCVAEIPGLNAITEKYGPDQINFIAIGRDDSPDLQNFLNQNPWKFEQIPNGEQIIRNEFKIRWGFPTTFVLNKNAEIIYACSGGKSDETAVDEIQERLIPVLEEELKRSL